MSAFGKPGRPPEDRVQRKQAIFLAVAPLLVDPGVARMSMAIAARSAHLSVGGLYHYFATKRDLALYGLAPENLERLCADFRAHHARAGTPPAQLLDASVADLAAAAHRFVRPSLVAAADLGVPTLRQQLDSALATEVIGLVETIRLAHPELREGEAAQLDRALRRACATSLLDPSITAVELRAMLLATIGASVAHLSPV